MSHRKCTPETVQLPAKLGRELSALVDRTGRAGRKEVNPSYAPWSNRVNTRRLIHDFGASDMNTMNSNKKAKIVKDIEVNIELKNNEDCNLKNKLEITTQKKVRVDFIVNNNKKTTQVLDISIKAGDIEITDLPSYAVKTEVKTEEEDDEDTFHENENNNNNNDSSNDNMITQKNDSDCESITSLNNLHNQIDKACAKTNNEIDLDNNEIDLDNPIGKDVILKNNSNDEDNNYNSNEDYNTNSDVVNNYSLVDLSLLSNAISMKVHCKECYEYNGQVDTTVFLDFSTVGIATNVSLRCCNGHKTVVQSCFKENDSGKFLTQQKRTLRRYSTNHHVVLGMLVNGLGFTGLATFIGSLGLSNVGLRCTGSSLAWRLIETEVDVALIEVAKEVCNENIALEIAATKKQYPENKLSVTGHYPLAVSLDSGWQKRSSGSRYDSNSSHCLIVGGVSKRVLGFKVYSKVCAKCDYNNGKTKGGDEGNQTVDEDDNRSSRSRDSVFSIYSDKEEEEANKILINISEKDKVAKQKHEYKNITNHYSPEPHPNCPKNFIGSSKAMEPWGAVALVTTLFRTSCAWAATIITDDDSTTRAALHHCFADKLEKGIWKSKQECWPKVNNKYSNDTGKLPLDVPEPLHFLADPSHRKKVYGKSMYKIAIDTTIKGFSKNDAKNLKSNFGYAQAQYRGEEMHKFQERFTAAIDHTFNKHDLCDSKWCKFKNNQKKIDEFGAIKYKDVSYDCYAIVKEAHDKLTTKEKLLQIHHPYNTQQNESLNRAVAKQAPKNITYCKSMSLKGRVAFVVAVSGIGYECTIERVCEKLNIELPTSIAKAWKDFDKKKNYKRTYDNKPIVKRKRTEAIIKAMKKQRLEENNSKKKGYNYGAGIALLPDIVHGGNKNDNSIKVVSDEKKSIKKDCICGSNTHQRTTSKKCKFYKVKQNAKDFLQECVVVTTSATLVENNSTNVLHLEDNTEKNKEDQNS